MNLKAFKALAFIAISFFLIPNSYSQCGGLHIAGVVDGPLTGGIPKAVQVCANADIADLSLFGIGVANNGGGTDGQEFTFPAISVSAGDCFTIATETAEFISFFGCAPDFIDTDMAVNGDDAIELFCEGVVEDLYGDINTDGTGQPWEYLDSWAVATDAVPNTTFDITEWSLGGVNALDGETSNATAATPYPNTVCSMCAIDAVMIGAQTACDETNNTYSQEITISYTDEPSTGNLVVNGMSFAITGSPQNINLMGLTADGNPVTVDASFDANSVCALNVPNAFTAPDACVAAEPVCSISGVFAKNYSCNDDNTINIDVCFSYENPLSSKVAVDVDGATFGPFGYPASGGCVTVQGAARPAAGVVNISVYDASSSPSGAVFLSEFHYDNTGTDTGEFIEVSGNAGTSINGYAVVLYNGNGGTAYNEIPLSGTLTDGGNGCGTFLINLPPNGIQNGSPDGVALIDASGAVLEFLSYEGTFVATDGPAAGVMSVDIDVEEMSSSPAGSSVSLIDGGWEFSTTNSAGMYNDNLSCTQPCAGTLTYNIPNIGPAFLCPGDKLLQMKPGSCGEITRISAPEVLDDCGGFTVEQTAGPMGSDFIDIFNSPYIYSYLVTDSDGNTAECSFNVEVIEYQNTTDVLSCNDAINITVNSDCDSTFTADMLLEGGPYGCFQNYETLAELVPGETNVFQVTVTDPETGSSCWGMITVEDKEDPVIDCEICPVVDGMSAADYDPDCVLACYEQPILQLRYDDGLRDDLIQEDYEDFADDAMSDNCDNWNEDQVSFYDQYESLGACVGTRLTRTWSVGFTRADGSQGSVSCTRQYFFQPIDLSTAVTYDTIDGQFIIEPKEDSLVLPPNIIELPCGVDISPAGIAAFFDNPLTEDRDTDDNNIDPDELDVDLVVEFNEGYAWAYPHYYQDGVGSGGPHAQKIDTEVCNLISGYTDTEIEACAPGCAGNRKVLREWVVLDWCTGQFAEYSQIIKSIDTRGPQLSLNNATYSVDPWNCTVDALLPAPEHLSDDCDNDVTYYIGNTGGYDVTGDYETGYTVVGLPLGMHTIEYRSEDCCGNVGFATMTVRVVDETAPVAVSKEFIVLSLSNVGNQVDEFQGFAKIYAEDVDNGSYDGCTDVTLEVRRSPVCDEDDADWGPFVTFCCEDLQGGTQANIDVELRISDENGNHNIVWATVLLEDKSATVPSIPPHMFLTCDMDYNDFELTGGFPRFFGACGEAAIECDTMEVIENTEPRELRLSDGVVINGIPQVAPAYDPSCGFGAIRRQFRDCGGGEQWFVIRAVDPFDDSTITFPEDVVVDCDDYEIGAPSWEEATCNLVGVSMESDTFLFEDGACFKILNHWSVINWCVYDPSNPTAGGRYEHTQVVKIIDTQDPVLSVVDSLCFAVDVDCTSKDVSMSGSAIDAGDCGSEWISWEVSIDAYADWTEDFNYATTNPRLLPNGEPNPYHMPKTGNGEEATITLPDGIPSTKVWHRSVWRAYDGCGNTVSATRYFQITDKKAPTPYCLNISTAVMSNGEVELWAIDFNVGSFDNCTDSDNLLYTFTNVVPPARNDEEYDSNDDLMWYNGTFWYYNSEEVDLATGAGEYETQDDFGGEVHRWEPGLRSAGKIFTIDDADENGFAQIPIYVWDECGNYDFCVVNLRIVDNGGGGMAMVAGQVTTEFGEEVEQVVTNLNGPLNFNDSDMTDATGTYAFTNTPLYADYEVSGTKTDDYLNGVSTLDLVLIQRHILGQTRLDSPYKMIAADINGDDQITSVDLLELRKLILGIYSELPNNASWKLVNSDNSLTVSSPWNYDETITIAELSDDMDNENFIGVKIGDVNASVVANAQSANVSSRNSSIDVNFDDKVIAAGEQVSVSLSTDRNDVYGYQFTLNTKGLELVEVQGNNLTQNNVGVFANRLTLSYNENQAINAGNLVTLVVRATQAGQLSEMLSMGSELTKAEAYVGENLEVVEISLRDNTENTFELYQNEPNPFSEYTVIGFEMPNNGKATISLFDVTGKVMKVINGNYTAGYNSVTISKDDLGAAGMVYYKLQTGDYTATKHMVVVK